MYLNIGPGLVLEDKGPGACGVLADIFYRQNCYGDALWFCNRALIDDESDFLRGLRASIFLEWGNYGAALADCNRGLELNDKHATLYGVRARAYAGLGFNEEAMRDCAYGLALCCRDEERAKLYRARATIYKNMGEVYKAKDDFTVALKLAKQQDPMDMKLLKQIQQGLYELNELGYSQSPV